MLDLSLFRNRTFSAATAAEPPCDIDPAAVIGGGTIPRSNIVGEAFALVWPLDRFSGLGNPWGADAVSEDNLATQTPVPSASS